jgi:DNA-binding NarL/FixJ family response regulator
VKGTELRLSPDYFTPRDVLLLREVLAGEKYEIIARTYNLGLSTLKKRLLVFFSLLNETNKTELVNHYAGYRVQLEIESS